MKAYSILFSSTAVQLGFLKEPDIKDAYKVFQDGQCIACKEFPWGLISCNISSQRTMRLNLDITIGVCIQNTIFEKFIPTQSVFHQYKIIDEHTEFWYDCKTRTLTEKDKELIKTQPWLKDILFPIDKCYPVQSVLIKKDGITIDYLNHSFKFMAKGYTKKIMGQWVDPLLMPPSNLKPSQKSNDSTAYNDGLDIDQQSISYLEDIDLF